jgi:hypothetical protein
MTNQSIANVVVAVLNEAEIDGEMMEDIINRVGMRDQMIKQLVTNKEEIEAETPIYSFTQEQLISFTLQIQERCKAAIVEAIKGSGLDCEDMVELELEYDKTITVSFDEGALYREIESLIDDTFETDDDSVMDEIKNILKSTGN